MRMIYLRRNCADIKLFSASSRLACTQCTDENDRKTVLPTPRD